MTRKLSVIVLFFVLAACTKKPVHVNKFLGTWHDTEYIIPGSSELKIKSDSSFMYTSAGCQWRMFSQGKWKMIGDSIELTSIKSDTCYRIWPFVNCIPFQERDKKELLTVPNCVPEGKTDFVYFSKEIFYLKSDSLNYKIKKESRCADTLKIIYARTEKIRK